MRGNPSTMSGNNGNNDKGSESRHNNSKKADDLTPEDVFGTSSPNEEDGIISESGDYILWLEDNREIYVEHRDGERVPRREYNYLNRLFEKGIASAVCQVADCRIEITVDHWIISKKESPDDTNVVGDAEDLLPVVAEAL